MHKGEEGESKREERGERERERERERVAVITVVTKTSVLGLCVFISDIKVGLFRVGGEGALAPLEAGLASPLEDNNIIIYNIIRKVFPLLIESKLRQ